MFVKPRLVIFSAIFFALAFANVLADAKSVTVATDLPDAPAESSMPEEGRRRVGDKVAIGTSLTVAADEFVQGGIVCIACSGRIDGRVLGDIVVVGGKVDISGSAIGQLVAVGSKVTLEPGARVNGDVVNIGGKVQRNDDQIGGEVVDLAGPMTFGTPWGLGSLGGFFGFLDMMFGIWFAILSWVLLIIVLMLLAALVPDRIRRITEEVPVIPVAAFLWGLLAYVLVPFGVLLLVISCIGIPVLPFAIFAFMIFKWLGMAGIFLFVGRRIGRWFHRDLPLLGAILLGMVPFLLLRLLPFCCVGWLTWFVLEIFAIGYVIATRAGRPPRQSGFAIPPPPAPIPPPVAFEPGPPDPPAY